MAWMALHNISCVDGCYGAACNQSCPGFCPDGVCDLNGSCSYYCGITGFYGPNCTKPCSEGFYGVNSEETCSDNCQNRLCDRFTGTCLRCNDGYYGEHCDIECHRFCMTCDLKSGECDVCLPGFYGDNCSNICPTQCNHRGCNFSNGMCSSCVSGWYGSACELNCTNCASCDQNTGICHTECQQAWYGAKCDKSCPDECTGHIFFKDNGTCIAYLQDGNNLTGVYAGISVLVAFTVFLLFGIVFLSIKVARKSQNEGGGGSNQHPETPPSDATPLMDTVASVDSSYDDI